VLFEIFAQSWWEPGSDGTLDVGDLAIILGFVVSVIGAFTALSRWWMKQLKRIIHDEVEEFTAPIQPTANGGLSLPDVARKVERLEDTIENVKVDLKEDTVRLEKSIDDLREENRQTWGLLIKHLMKNDESQ
jgi:hypothetical protein